MAMPVCVICKKGPQDGLSLHRINAKGVPGLWACFEHVNALTRQPTVQTAEALTSGFINRLQRMKTMDALYVLSKRDAAIRADERGKVLEWRPIESAPKDGTNVLMYADHNGYPKYGIGSFTTVAPFGRTGEILWDWGWMFPPTHWQPLFAPPQPTKQESTNG